MRMRSSTQAGYRLTFSTEGNAVGKVVRWLGDVGRLIEVGTPIGITRRDIAKHRIIQFYYCVFQYERVLKTERYINVRVVPLLILMNFYQGVNLEVILKYGNGDISESSWVFRCPKDSEARDGPLLSQSTTQKLMEFVIFQNDKVLRKSVRQILLKGDYLVMSCSWHIRFPRPSVFLPKISNPARINWGGILEESRVVRE